MKPARLLTLAAILPLAGITADAALTTNSWTNSVSSKWERGINWSLAVPPTNTHAGILITNATSKTVTIDATTVLSNALNGCMTISNLTVQGLGADINTLQLTNAGVAVPLRILNDFTLGTNAVLLVTNSVLRVDGLSGGSNIVNGALNVLTDGVVTGSFAETIVGSMFDVAGTLTVDGGSLFAATNIQAGFVSSSTGTIWVAGSTALLVSTNGTTTIAFLGVGQMTVSNGTWLARGVDVGFVGNSQGTLTIAGGTNRLSSALTVGSIAGSTGAVWLTSSAAQLVVTNNSTVIGNSGVGQMIVSNGTWLARNVIVGSLGGSQGTLTMAGGTNALSSALTIGSSANTTGTVWLTGSDTRLVVTNANINVGGNGVGQMAVSNGIWLAANVIVGGFQGTLTIAGGTNRLSSVLSIGNAAGATGAVWVTGSDTQLVATNGGGGINIGIFGVGQMIVSNGAWLARDVNVGLFGGSQGTLTIAGGTSRLDSSVSIGSSANATGTVVLAGGSLFVTNAAGNAVLDVRSGSLLLNAGTLTVDKLIVTNGLNSVFTFNGGALASQSSFFTNGAVPVVIGAVSNSATFNFQGTAHFLANGLTLGNTGGSTGTVWMTGTKLVVTNGDTKIGFSGLGQMTMSNGTWLARRVDVGSSGSSQGTLTIAGGDCFIAGNLFIAFSASATGTVWVTGGQLTNDSIRIGQLNFGQMTVSNGTVSAKTVFVAGDNFGSRGIWTIVGGTNKVDTSLTLGNFACASTGTVILAGGSLFVTNAAGNAVLEVRSGSLVLNSGTLTVDQLILTNPCASFVHTGGTLIYGSAVLSSNRDDDADGILNDYEQSHGLDPLDPSDANLDPDGDGFTNLQEFQAGTDATNSASFFGITAITQVSTNILITWQTGPGKTNALERTAGMAGSFTNNFVALTNIITTTTTTNYLDLGAATNVPSFYYRVRLVP